MYETSSNGAFDSLDLGGSRYFPLEMVGGKNQSYDSHAGHRRSHHVSHTAGSTWILRVASKHTPDYRPHRPERKGNCGAQGFTETTDLDYDGFVAHGGRCAEQVPVYRNGGFLSYALVRLPSSVSLQAPIYCALYVMDYSSARFTSILLLSILAPIFSAVRRNDISDREGIGHQPGCRAIRMVCHRQYFVTP